MTKPKRTQSKKALTAADLPVVAPPAPTVRTVPPYNVIVATSRLDTIRLVGTSFAVHPEYFAGEKSLAVGGDMKTAATNTEAGTAVGLFEFWVEAKGRESKETLLRFDCSYVVGYGGLDLSSEELEAAAKLFVNRVGKFAVYPYVRGMLSRLSAEAGVDLPPLPVLKESTSGTQQAAKRQGKPEAAEEKA